MANFTKVIRHSYDAFKKRAPTDLHTNVGETVASYKPDRVRFTRGNQNTIATSIYNRIAMDVSTMDIRHVYVDENGAYTDEVDSGFNYCLSTEPNIDQIPSAFVQDMVSQLMNEGTIAVVPIDTDRDPDLFDEFDIESLRIGKILEWRPRRVKVDVYNDKTGQHEQIYFNKKHIAIIENPLYAVVNEQNSVMQRLVRKLSLLDAIDEQSGAGKLDMIIQLPYVIKTEAKRKQVESRRKEIETQLAGSKYGIAYTDGTEKVTQLNRSLDNNLMKQIEYLTSMAYSQLSITQSIMDGTADEETMLNYYTRTIEPILSSIVEEFKRKFVSRAKRKAGESVMYFRDPFKLVPVGKLADIADKLTRNEIMSSNEVRQKIGLKPSKDPKADELRNKNISQPTDQPAVSPDNNSKEENQNE